jgi:hypothetical protein
VTAIAESFPNARDPVAALIEHIPAEGLCRQCGQPLEGRQRLWCSNVCRVYASRYLHTARHAP